MPLDAHMPNLDRQTAEEIFEAARLRIPLYTPEWEVWTDYNESDPGITLLQLFAWLTEQMLFQMNQVPERNYLKFLQLLNVEQRPAQPATAHLTFTPSGRQIARAVAVRTQVAAESPEGGGQLIYETENGLDVISVPLKHVVAYDGLSFSVVSPLNESGTGSYRPFGWTGQPGGALYLGFEPPQFSVPLNEHVFPQRLAFRVFLPPASQSGQAQNANDFLSDSNGAAETLPVELVWEYRPAKSNRWQALDYEDESSAFMREGYIYVEGPAQSEIWQIESVDEACMWLRCRIADRAYPAGKVPEISFIRPNVVPIKQLCTMRDELLGISNGERAQTFNLRRQPVLPDSLVLKLQLPTGEVEKNWERKDDFLASERNDAHYTLQATNGAVTFGDGKRGRIPPAGTEIIACRYRYGGGRAGNVGPDAVRTSLATLIGIKEVKNERAAVGGRDEEDIEELKHSAPKYVRARNRAVTREDLAELAKGAGGVARAEAFPLMHPHYPSIDVPGAVTVVIVPDHDERPPIPSDALIRSVCEYLNPFRVLTTELFVKGPEYIPVRVVTTISVDSRASTGLVREAVEQAINTYLDPKKRTLGEDLYPTRIYDLIFDVPSVRAVEFLEVFVRNQPVEQITQRQRLQRDELLYGVDHEINIKPYEDR